MSGTGRFDAQAWAGEHAGFFDLSLDEVAQVVKHWRDVAATVCGGTGVEVAGPFQRHYTARGTGVPPNFCLVLTAEEAIAFKFDPAQIQHPLLTGPGQFSGEEARWQRGSLRAGEVDPGRLAWGVRIEVDGGKPIPCRTPRLPRNPAAAAVITALGGRLG